MTTNFLQTSPYGVPSFGDAEESVRLVASEFGRTEWRLRHGPRSAHISGAAMGPAMGSPHSEPSLDGVAGPTLSMLAVIGRARDEATAPRLRHIAELSARQTELTGQIADIEEVLAHAPDDARTTPRPRRRAAALLSLGAGVLAAGTAGLAGRELWDDLGWLPPLATIWLGVIVGAIVGTMLARDREPSIVRSSALGGILAAALAALVGAVIDWSTAEQMTLVVAATLAGAVAAATWAMSRAGRPQRELDDLRATLASRRLEFDDAAQTIAGLWQEVRSVDARYAQVSGELRGLAAESGAALIDAAARKAPETTAVRDALKVLQHRAQELGNSIALQETQFPQAGA